MFVRKKKNRSGSISIVVVSKSHGQFKEVKHFGVVQTDSEAEQVYQSAPDFDTSISLFFQLPANHLITNFTSPINI
jgi:hypothetical protein